MTRGEWKSGSPESREAAFWGKDEQGSGRSFRRRRKGRQADFARTLRCWLARFLAAEAVLVAGFVWCCVSVTSYDPPVAEPDILTVIKEVPVEVTVTPEADQIAEATWDAPLTGEEMTALLDACEAGNIDPAVGLGLIQVESSFQSGAVNPGSGCYGYCQLNPRYFPAELSPEENIRTGIGYLAEQLEHYGDLEAALTAYHAGHDTGDRIYADLVLEAAEAFGEGNG